MTTELPQADLAEAYRQLDRIITDFMLGEVTGAAVAEVQQRFRSPDASDGQCHWDLCPHGVNCTHAAQVDDGRRP